MKSLLKSVILFFGFVIGGILFQLSCSSSDEQNLVSTSQLNKFIFTKGVGEIQTIWTCDYDGSNLTQIPITLPSGIIFNGTNGNAYPRLSPDGQMVFFVCMDQNDNSNAIYSCNVSGSNLQEVYNSGIASPTNNNVIGLGSVN